MPNWQEEKTSLIRSIKIGTVIKRFRLQFGINQHEPVGRIQFVVTEKFTRMLICSKLYETKIMDVEL